MRRPPVVSYTLYALEATEFAIDAGSFDPFHRGLYTAYWEDGKDLGDLKVIRGVAEACELDWAELGPLLESAHYRDKVMGYYQEGLDLGIQGIPAFLIGEIMFTGARPYEIFKAVMTRATGEGESA